jgi:outer membrane protein assembly factor BamD
MHRTKFNSLVALIAVMVFTGCGGRKAASQPKTDTSDSAEADKVLYERAVNDLQHSRYELTRLTMQTLINTYPDSEYLAKAKLAIADSYFKEGGTTGLTQAVAEYQDFITFFPFLDEAAYAQMQVAMAHYRRMEKADRDRTEALEAEAAFQTFLQKYPRTELTPKAEQRLREVQETLAEGDYRIATFYYIRRADKAAAPRLLDLVNRYPLYSDADRANWMLASIYERNQHNDVASTYYAKLVKEYPLSPLASGAKAKLVKFGAPVPQADPTALARMQREQEIPRDRPGLLRRPVEALKTGPDVSSAARVGAPTLTPQSAEPGDTLAPGAGLSVVASGGASSGGNASGTAAYVETVSPGSSDPPASASGGTSSPSSGSTSGGSNDPPSASTGPSSGGQPATTGNPGQSASGVADPSGQATQKANQGESSSKKKKGKKNQPQPLAQPQLQPQPQVQPQPQPQ